MTTQQRKKLVIDALVPCAGIITATCMKAGVSRAQFYRWLNSDPDFAAEVKEFLAKEADLAETRLKILMSKNDRWALAYYLNNKGRHLGYGRNHGKMGTTYE